MNNTKKVSWSLYFAFNTFRYASTSFIISALKLTQVAKKNLASIHFNYFSHEIKK